MFRSPINSIPGNKISLLKNVNFVSKGLSKFSWHIGSGIINTHDIYTHVCWQKYKQISGDVVCGNGMSYYYWILKHVKNEGRTKGDM